MFRICVVSICLLMLTVTSIEAQGDEEKGKTFSNFSTSYQLIRGPDKKWDLVPVWSSNKNTKIEITPFMDSIAAKKFDYLVSKDSAGEIKAVFAGKSGDPKLDQIKGELQKDGQMYKVGFEQLPIVGSLFIPEETEEDLAEKVKNAIVLLADEAVLQACALKLRPTKFSFNAEVQISLGLGGKINVGSEWNTNDICN